MDGLTLFGSCLLGISKGTGDSECLLEGLALTRSLLDLLKEADDLLNSMKFTGRSGLAVVSSSSTLMSLLLSFAGAGISSGNECSSDLS